MWSVWDKISSINGFSASDIMVRNKHLRNEDTIFIKTEGGHVTNVEGKNILAKHYNIDPSLPDDEFIAEYERILATPETAPEETINT